MPFKDYAYMLELKEIVEARRMLSQMKVSAYPHTKAENAKSFHRKISKRAFPVEVQKSVSNEEAFLKFKRMTNGK